MARLSCGNQMVYFLYPTQAVPSAEFTNIRWLEVDRDYPLAKEYWKALDQDLRQSTWETAYEYGYSYAGLIEAVRVISMAGVWRFSETHWEVVAVSTLPDWRNKGCSRRVIAFVTAFILEAGRQPTCSTDNENKAMITTAESVGFQRLPTEKVTWSYPRLPDF